MPPKNSRAKRSAPRVLRALQIPSDDAKTQPRDAATFGYATVAERCIHLWAEIFVRFVAIQRVFRERHVGPVGKAGPSEIPNAALLKSRMTMLKRLNTIHRSAQAGFQDALAMKIHCEDRSGASEWEMAKRGLEPWMREAAETYSSHMIKHWPTSSDQELKQRLDDKFKFPVDGEVLPLVRADEPLSRANETADLVMQSCTEQIGIIEEVLSQIDKRDAGTVLHEGLSKREINAWFRSRTTSMKRMINTLRAAQQGLRSAYTAQIRFKATTAPSEWETAEVQQDVGLREQCEKCWLAMSENSRAFGTPMPEFYEGIDYGPHKARVAALFGISNAPPAIVKRTKLRGRESKPARGRSMGTTIRDLDVSAPSPTLWCSRD
jgi:hypothetical protein